MNSLVNISEGSYLALHGLAYMVQHSSKRVSVKKLAEVLHASEAHLAKVFQKLNKADMVNSVRGPAGGFELSRDPEDLTFLEIFETIEGKVKLGGCPFGKVNCAFQHCIFNTELTRISQDIYDTFKNMKLSDFTE